MTNELSIGERAALGRIAEALFGDAPEPVCFGRYEVVHRIGQGAFGRVYRVRDPSLDRDIALKVLHASVDAERVSEEARAMAAVTHSNVVTVFDVGVLEDGQAYIAMQLVDGVDLRRWLDTRPPFGIVLDVVVRAGHGLAAAHRAGLVHGDFKPDNVLVDKGSIARVVDFGLARSSDTPTSEGEEDVASTVPRLRGTPAYMAPAQLGGQPPDAASDQFAFFVTLYEALHGKRPFAGTTPAELASAIAERKLAPVDKSLPRALRRAIERGLSARASDRFASMDAALAALRGRGHGRAIAAAVTIVALGGGGIAWGLAADPACRAPAALAWNDVARATGEHAYAATQLPYATQGWARARDRLDAWAQRWGSAWIDACAATAGVEARELRLSCLDAQRIAFATAVEQLVAGTPQTVRATAELAEALPDLATCESPSESAAAHAEVGSIAALVQQAQGRYLMADFPGAGEAAREASAAAESIGDARLLARARGWGAMASAREPDAEDPRERLREAFDATVAADDAAMAAMLAMSLATAHGYEARDLDVGQTWIREAETQLERAGRPPRLVARLHTVIATRHQVRGDLAAARDEAAKAVATLEAWDRTSVGLVDARANVGVLAQLSGDTPAAVEWFDAALTQGEAQLGPRHPTVGTIASNQMLPLITVGRYRDAERRGSDALAILGAEDPDVLINLGIALQLQGRAEDSRQRYADALRLVEARHGGDDPRVGQVLVNLADLDARHDRVDDAVAEIKRARTVLEAALPEGHPALAIVYATESLAHRRRGEMEAAIERGAAAHALAIASGDAGLRASVELEYGEALRLSGDARASEVLGSGEALAGKGHDPRLHARLLFALAQIDRSPALVQRAIDLYPADGDPDELAAMRL